MTNVSLRSSFAPVARLPGTKSAPVFLCCSDSAARPKRSLKDEQSTKRRKLDDLDEDDPLQSAEAQATAAANDDNDDDDDDEAGGKSSADVKPNTKFVRGARAAKFFSTSGCHGCYQLQVLPVRHLLQQTGDNEPKKTKPRFLTPFAQEAKKHDPTLVLSLADAPAGYSLDEKVVACTLLVPHSCRRHLSASATAPPPDASTREASLPNEPEEDGTSTAMPSSAGGFADITKSLTAPQYAALLEAKFNSALRPWKVSDVRREMTLIEYAVWLLSHSVSFTPMAPIYLTPSSHIHHPMFSFLTPNNLSDRPCFNKHKANAVLRCLRALNTIPAHCMSVLIQGLQVACRRDCGFGIILHRTNDATLRAQILDGAKARYAAILRAERKRGQRFRAKPFSAEAVQGLLEKYPDDSDDDKHLVGYTIVPPNMEDGLGNFPPFDAFDCCA